MPDPFVRRARAVGRRHRRAALAGLAAALAVSALAAVQAGRANAGRVPAGGAGAASGAAARQLMGVTCVSATNCWAVGGLAAGGPMMYLAEHWDGSRWSRVPAPAPARAASGQLTAVSCASASDCWAVGLYITRASRARAGMEHWDGTAWQPVRVPQPPQQAGAALTGVSCAGAQECAAVGSSQALGLAEIWNGTTWALVPTRQRGTSTVLSGVSCVSGTDCWAAGYWSTLARKGTLTEHWDGASWSAVRAPTSRNTHASLGGVSCVRAACMAVGATGAGGPLAEAFDGSGWALSAAASPPGAAWSQLGAVSCASASACMAVGGSAGGPAGQPLAEQWNGTTWSVTPAPVPAGAAASRLNGVWCVTAGDCWAVGSRDTTTRVAGLIEHWDGTSWTRA